MLRKAAALIIAAATLAAIYEVCVVPYRCNLAKGIVAGSLEDIDVTDEFAARSIAERNVGRLAWCLEHRPSDVRLQALAGRSFQILRRPAAAITAFETALRYDRRAELYMGLGLAQLDAGKREEAIASFVAAAELKGLQELAAIPDGTARAAAYRIAGARFEKALRAQGHLDTRNRLLNGSFAETAAGSARVDATAGDSPSPAQGWELHLSEPGNASAAIERSTRTGRNALHVIVDSADSGIRQTWPADRRPPHVRTSVWVYVVRGQVYAGSGNGNPPMANAVSTTTGRWERLEGVSESCPAGTTVIFAASEGGAEFYVDETAATLTLAAPPCDQ